MDENQRNRKPPKRGRKRLFNITIYNRRFSSERTFAWIDKFRALRVRDDRKEANFLGGHHIAFAMINLRYLFDNWFESVHQHPNRRRTAVPCLVA